MKHNARIEKQLKPFDIKMNDQKDHAIIESLLRVQAKNRQSTSASVRGDLWRIIMTSRK